MRIELNCHHLHHRHHNHSTYRTLAEEKSTDLHNYRTAALSFLHVQATANIVICAYPSHSSSCQYDERESPVPCFIICNFFPGSTSKSLTANCQHEISLQQKRTALQQKPLKLYLTR